MHPFMPLAIFLGSALLFCLQPMVGRTLLPAFGGSAAVWSVCLASFQALLVGGYSYAHVVSALNSQRQRRVHVALIGVAVLWALVVAWVGLSWARGNLHAGDFPALQVLVVVLLGVGVPYLVLSAGSSLLQAWASSSAQGVHNERAVYRLYAVSNLGSFVGLFAYPILLEPYVALRVQWLGWCAVLAVYFAMVACIALAKNKTRLAANLDALDTALADSRKPEKREPVELSHWLSSSVWWYVLPGLSAFTLVATTNHLSMDVAPMPLLWAILLGAFLLSYVAGFSHVGERWLPVWQVLAVGAFIACGYAAHSEGSETFKMNIAAGMALIFFGGTFLHGWLFAIRPEGSRLTRYYLAIAIGGAVGGVLVSFVAPGVFSAFREYPIAVVACTLAAFVFVACSWRRAILVRIYNSLFSLACVWACLMMWAAVRGEDRGIVLRERNFYGALKVSEVTQSAFGGVVEIYSLSNGSTLHGQQAWTMDKALSEKPTTYYGPLAGGLAVKLNQKWSGAAAPQRGSARVIHLDDGVMNADTSAMPTTGQPMRVGAIGLGIGTMVAWGRVGDDWTFFEINPLVETVARDGHYFSYLHDSRAKVHVALGDARLTLEREQNASAPLYDVLVVDAYSGDSVPLHLATEEAFQLYAKRLAPDGILAVHISNWHMDLLPLCKAAARALGMHEVGVVSYDNTSKLVEGALWVYLSRDPIELHAGKSGAEVVNFDQVRDIRMPTDGWGSLQGLIRFGDTTPIIIDEPEESAATDHAAGDDSGK